MMMAIQSWVMSAPAALAFLELDVDGYLASQEFLSALATLVSNLLMGFLSLFFFGSEMV